MMISSNRIRSFLLNSLMLMALLLCSELALSEESDEIEALDEDFFEFMMQLSLVSKNVEEQSLEGKNIDKKNQEEKREVENGLDEIDLFNSMIEMDFIPQAENTGSDSNGQNHVQNKR